MKKTQTISQKGKYNWDALKTEFITGDIEYAAEFCKQKFGMKAARNNWIMRKTKGWRDDRIEYQAKLAEDLKIQRMQNARDKEEKILKIANEAEQMVIQAVHDSIRLAIKRHPKTKEVIRIALGPHSLRELFEITRIAQGKSSSNINANVNVVDVNELAEKVTQGIAYMDKLKEELYA